MTQSTDQLAQETRQEFFLKLIETEARVRYGGLTGEARAAVLAELRALRNRYYDAAWGDINYVAERYNAFMKSLPLEA